MSRNMTGNDTDVFRVVIDREETNINPRRTFPGEPWLIKTGRIVQDYLGPYRTIGAARGQLKVNTAAYDGGFLTGIVGARVQKARTEWEDIA